MKNKKGFTLIELLAVIIILGILMIIAIPSVTQYINNSRKSAYIDTAKEIIAGARNFVNEGKLEMFSTDTTYYIPISCISTENGSKSPYGDFVEDQAYVLVTYDGHGYKYYWVSRDETGQGIKDPTLASDLDEDDIDSDIAFDYIKPTVTKDGTTSVKVVDKTSCDSFSKSAASIILENSSSSLATVANDIKVFKGSNPNNFVDFNGETWRILGVYGDQLKIIRSTKIGDRGYHNVSYNVTDNSWEVCESREYLNGTYYNSMSQTAQNMIDNGTFDTGKIEKDYIASASYTASHSKTWSGKVGLLTAYEFLYSTGDSTCYDSPGNNYNSSCWKSQNSWITGILTGYTWTMSPSTTITYNAILIGSSGYLSATSIDNQEEIFPVVYLKSSVQITDGNGSSSNHYQLG